MLCVPIERNTWRGSTFFRGDPQCPECLTLLVSIFENSRVYGIHGLVAYHHGSMEKESV